MGYLQLESVYSNAQALQDAMLAALGRRDRGIKILGRTDRGGRSLHAGRAPAVLVEPFFGSSTGDCRAADALGITGMAQMYLAGLHRYAGLPEVIGESADDDASSSSYLAAVDIVHDGLTREQFLTRNRAALRKLIGAINRRMQAEAHGEPINALTLGDACALMHAQLGTRADRVDARHQHGVGNRGLLPLPADLAWWNGPQSTRLGANVTPERNIKEYLLYLAYLKNRDIGRTFRGGVLYRDLFTQEVIAQSERRQTALLAAIVHGYFDAGRYHLGLPFAELSRRVVDAGTHATPLMELLDELGYRDLERDPGVIAAHIADLKEGLRLSRT